jgi:N-methylhydantoinase B/oxoprolinase/acetone carboxylase alpha subunit
MTRLAIDTIWPRLIAAADEMATTLFRTAFSHDVVEVHDMSTALFAGAARRRSRRPVIGGRA